MTPEAPRTTGSLAGVSKEITVLVVEDNVSNFVVIARILGYLGIHCEWKTSGYEVLEYADSIPRLDLILMDLRLPYEDGYGALKKIRQSPWVHRRMPQYPDSIRFHLIKHTP